jgi:uncharacterized membrane protein YdjX (TVP38/TMEM64 family)
MHAENPGRVITITKILFALALITSMFLLCRMWAQKGLFNPETVKGFLESLGIWAPIIFILIQSIIICLFLPASVLTIAGAAVFGAYWGFLYVWIGTLAGATGAFFIGRTLGRDMAVRLIGRKLSKYDDAIERNGFATVLYLRLINFPFGPMNFGMGLTKVHFRDYFMGTGLGITGGIFILIFLGDALRSVWISNRWAELISTKFFVAIALFLFSISLPMVMKKIRIGH